ncbi:MAG: TIGR01777 family oxidoreductase [Planctomycetes bacterium]|nr:TIGR01777 family oxidoreductase [Planctomycetota bacterium]
MKVFITGGTGLIGGAILGALRARGDDATALTRDPGRARARLGEGVALVQGDPAVPGAWEKAVEGADAAIALAGEPIFPGRWTAEKKERIRASRIDGMRNLARAIENARPRPRILISTSAIAYYGPRGDEEVDESGAPGSDYLANLCLDWEAAAGGLSAIGVRTVILRFGIVLAPAGGALARMLPPFRWFVGGPIGSGEQWVSWIHIADGVGLVFRALDEFRMEGAFNATAPQPVRNRDLAKAIGATVGRPAFVRTPAWMLRLFMGEVAGVLLTGQRVIPRAALAAGYAFRFPELRGALQDLLADRKA